MVEWRNMRETDKKPSRTAQRTRYAKKKNRLDKKRKERVEREGRWKTDDQPYD
jgi:hypothetical protein